MSGRGLVEDLEGIALVAQPLDRGGEGGVELVDGFQRVVEGNDGAITRVPLYIINHIFGRHPLRVVAGDEIPHHNLVFPAEPGVLRQTHPTVWRTYIVAVDVGVGLLHVVAVFLDGVGETDHVVVGVVAHLVAFIDDALVELRMFAHVVAHHEERGLDAERLEGVEDEGRSLGNGTVVEGQIDGLLVTIHSPIGFRIKPPQVYGGLLNKHRINLRFTDLRFLLVATLCKSAKASPIYSKSPPLD